MKKTISTLVFLLLASFISFGQLRVETPTMIAPNNGATDQMPDVLLNWSAVLGANAYHLMVATDEDFTNIVLDKETVLAAYQNQFLSFNTTFYWKVRAIQGSIYSEFTDTRNFSTFEKIGLRRPNNGSGNHEVLVDLEWLDKVGNVTLSGFTRYQIQVDTANIFEEEKNPFNRPVEPIWDIKINFGTLKFAINNLYFGQTMYWRARAIHPNDTSAWSTPFSFTTKNQIALDRPVNNSNNLDLSFDLRWKEFKGCLEYEYQVHPNENFSNAVAFITDKLTATVPKVMFGETYYWRAKGLNLRDTSDWSAPWSFTTKAAVTLKQPVNNEDSVSLKPILRWEQIRGVSCYNIEYASTSDFENAVSVYQETNNSQTNPFYTILLSLQESTQYYWRVRACAPHDTSAFSPVWSFTTIAPVGINELFSNQNVVLSPNPTTGKSVMNVSMGSATGATLSVTDLSGKEILSKNIHLIAGENNIELDMFGKPKGVYLVNLRNEQNVHTTKLIIK